MTADPGDTVPLTDAELDELAQIVDIGSAPRSVFAWMTRAIADARRELG